MNPSLCIPKIENNITKLDIIEIFQNKLKIGDIDRVDIIQKSSETNFSNRAFIHFKRWNVEENDISKKILLSLTNKEVVKIVYEFPWYWKCYISKIPKPNFY